MDMLDTADRKIVAAVVAAERNALVAFELHHLAVVSASRGMIAHPRAQLARVDQPALPTSSSHGQAREYSSSADRRCIATIVIGADLPARRCRLLSIAT